MIRNSVIDILGGKYSQNVRIFTSALTSFLNLRPRNYAEKMLHIKIAAYAEAVAAGNADALDAEDVDLDELVADWRIDYDDIPPKREPLVLGLAVFNAEPDRPPFLRRCAHEPCRQWFRADRSNHRTHSDACRSALRRTKDK